MADKEASTSQEAQEQEDAVPEQPEKTPEQIMREQEEMMMKKYGGMKPKKKGLLQTKEHKFFDSADWALNKEAASKQGGGAPGAPAPVPVPEEKLKPKLEPTVVPPRRVSHLDPMDKVA